MDFSLITTQNIGALRRASLKPQNSPSPSEPKEPFDSFKSTSNEVGARNSEKPSSLYQEMVSSLRENAPALLEVARSDEPIARKIAHQELLRYSIGPKSWETKLNPVDALGNRDSFGRFRDDFPSGFWKENREILALIEKLPTPKFLPAVNFVLRAEQSFRSKVAEGHDSYQEGVDDAQSLLQRWSEEGRFESNGRSLDNGRLSVRNGIPTLVEKPPIRPDSDMILTPELLKHELNSVESLPNTDDLRHLKTLVESASGNPELKKIVVEHIPQLVNLAGVAEDHNSLKMGFQSSHTYLMESLAKACPEEMETPEVLVALAPHFRHSDGVYPSMTDLASRIWKKHPETIAITLEQISQSPPDNIYPDPTKTEAFERAVVEFGEEPSARSKAWAVSQVYNLDGRGVCGRTSAERTAPILRALRVLEERDPDSLKGITLPFEGKELSPKAYLKALAFESKTTISKLDFESAIKGGDFVEAFIDYNDYRKNPNELFELAQSKSPEDKFGKIIATALLGNLAKSQKDLQPKVLQLMQNAKPKQIKELAKELEFKMKLEEKLPPEELVDSMVEPGLLDVFDLKEALEAYPEDLSGHMFVNKQASELGFEEKWERYSFHSDIAKEQPESDPQANFKKEFELRQKYGDEFVETHIQQLENYFEQNDMTALDTYFDFHQDVKKQNNPPRKVEYTVEDDTIIIDGETLEVDL